MVAGITSSVFINEFHYDNSGGDVGEFIEIANTSGVDLTGWTILLYNGSNGTVYNTIALFGTDTFTTLALPANGLQNGSPDGIALVDADGNVVQFLSYEGSFTAVGGAADGLTSTDIGLAESGSTAIGESLQLEGSGSVAGDFTWVAPAAETPGLANNTQTIQAALATTTILDEGFETDGNGTRYVTSTPEFSDGFGDFFTRTDGSNIGSFYQVTGFTDEFFFAVQDIDGEGASSQQTLSFTGLDISGLTNLTFSIDVAEDDDGTNQDWDLTDFVKIEFQVDGGGFQNLLAFESVPDGDAFNAVPAQDTDFDGDGDGAEVTNIFQNFNATIAGAGSLLDIRITFDLNSGDEDFAIDNVKVTGEPVQSATVLSEGFETDGNGTRYVTSTSEFSDGSGDFFTRTDGSNIGSFYQVTGQEGSFFFAGMDLDGEGAASTQSLTFNDLDISGLTNLQLMIDVAEDDDSSNQDWDANSALRIEVSIDNGAFVNLLAFEAVGGTNTEPAQDTDFDGIGDGTTLTDIFQTFSAAIAGTGSSLDVRITWENLDAGDEDAAIDNVVITGDRTGGGNPDPRPGALSLDDVEALEGDAGTTNLVFTVTRAGGTDGAVSADFAVVFDADANAADLGTPLSGTVSFADGETSQTITIPVNGDTDIEPTETFTVELSNPQGGATIDDGVGTGTIITDDFAPQGPAEVFVNEFHYDNSGGDVGEAIEIAGPAGTDLSGWQVVFYNGNGGGAYATLNLTGTIPDLDDGFGTLGFTQSGIQNGAPDGFALVNPSGSVVQFLSYEGTLTATDGPASGLTSEDIGVAEGGSTPAGFSLQLAGTGTFYEDFTWETPRDDNFGEVNTGQDFFASNPNGSLFIDDAEVVEGDSGTATITFNVFRAGGSTGAISADFAVDFGTDFTDADASDFSGPTSGTVSFADGESFTTITLEVAGDTLPEPSETFDVVLSNPTGGADLRDPVAVGKIINDDPINLQIGEIQGAGHTSIWVDNEVTTTGVVTAVATNGFYMQDADGDGDAATSDGIFVFTGGAPTVSAGDGLTVTGTVGEFRPGNDPANLTITQLSDAQITVESTGNPLPAATLIGPDGLTPPTEVIEDDDFTDFDQANDGIDFWESLEGMLVEVQNPVAVDSTNGFGELWTAASDGDGNLAATNVSDEGLLVIDGGVGGLGEFDAGAGSDFNPERVQIDSAGPLNGVDIDVPGVTPGTVLDSVVGVVDYAFENFQVRPTEEITIAQASTSVAETTTLVPGAQNQLSIATYNVLNLDINDADGDDDVANGRFDAVAFDIGVNLAAPDIVVLQEVQDDSGSANEGTVSAQLTLEALAQSIFDQTGIEYSVFDNPFVVDGESGGQPGGNIRVAFLYRDDRVDLDEASAFTIVDDTGAIDAAFNNSRAPLGAEFTFNGEKVTVIGNHFTSKIGSDSSFSADQPPTNNGALTRAAQAAAVNAFVDDLLAADADAKIAVAGDFNEFQFEEPMEVLTGELDFNGGEVTETDEQALTNLTFELEAEDRFSVLFQGNAQQLDHILVSDGLAEGAQIDAVHTNTPVGLPASDHDPILALLNVGTQTIAGTNRRDFLEGNEGDDIINGGKGRDTLIGNGGNDELNGGKGRDRLEGGEGDDILNGGNGSDILFGGNGADILTGGRGFDRFVLDADGAPEDADVVTDFGFGDKLRIENAGGKAISFTQDGADTLIMSDGVLIATVLNSRALVISFSTQYDERPVSIDRPGLFDFGGLFGRSSDSAIAFRGDDGPSSAFTTTDMAPIRVPIGDRFREDGVEVGVAPSEFDIANSEPVTNPFLSSNTLGVDLLL